VLTVWIPFQGNLNNQGLGSEISSTSGTINYANGNLGKCISLKDNAINVKLDSIPNTMSVCFWVKAPTINEYTDIFSFGKTQKYCNRLEILADGSYYWYASSGNSDTTYNLIAQNLVFKSTEIDNTIWQHIAITIDGTNVKFYANGTLCRTFSQVNSLITCFQDNPYITIGARTSGLHPYLGYLSDFRVYNEVLNPKMVEEISKGQCFHLQMNCVARENLVSGNFSCTSSNTEYKSTGNLNVTFSSDDLINNKERTLCFSYDVFSDGEAKHNSDSSSYSYNRFGIHGVFYYKNTNGTTKTLYPFADELPYGKSERRVYMSYIIPKDISSDASLYLNMQTNPSSGFCNPADTNSNVWYIRNCKLEWDDFTPYIPAPSDSIYTALGFDQLDVDCSGYANQITYSTTPPLTRIWKFSKIFRELLFCWKIICTINSNRVRRC
jgi:hypothetical protein